jgi:tRNA (guanine26-N2/guanine27-N2)-dimethyltransferase
MLFFSIIEGGMGLSKLPEGWPGSEIIEGKTLTNVPIKPEGQKGPAPRQGSGFLNPAMAGSRTRSVLMLNDALENNWLVKPDAQIRIIDALAATSIRSRRWLNEIPQSLVDRLVIVSNDLDETAVSWARANQQENPTLGQLEIKQGDARISILESGWQWIDIDPFGSPIPFLDVAMQSCARTAVVDVCATDTAALTGSATSSGRRRYDAMAVVDDLRHDTAMRVLLGSIARCAARHDRVIEPLLVMFDDHHVRATVLVRRSKKEASIFQKSMGWRIHLPTPEEIQISMDAGLHPIDEPFQPRLSCMLPFELPPALVEGRISGPLWIGVIGNEDIMSRLTVEKAKEICASDSEQSKQHVARSVKGLAESASGVGCKIIIPVDQLPRLLDIPGPPSPSKLVELLTAAGHLAAPAVLQVPAIRTDAPWSAISEACQEIFKNHPAS